MDDLVQAMGGTGISKSQVSRLCEDEPLSAIGPRTMASDERVDAFLTRPIDGEWPYLWIDATYPLHGSGLLANRERDKVRQGGRIVSVAVTIAVGVNMDGRREVLGMAIGPSEAFRGLRRPAGATVPFTLLDGVSARSGAARAAWREAGHQRCARGECPDLCVSGPVHAVSDTQASKRSPNIMANWLRAANHSRTFLPSFSNLRIAR